MVKSEFCTLIPRHLYDEKSIALHSQSHFTTLSPVLQLARTSYKGKFSCVVKHPRKLRIVAVSQCKSTCPLSSQKKREENSRFIRKTGSYTYTALKPRRSASAPMCPELCPVASAYYITYHTIYYLSSCLLVEQLAD